MTIGSTTAGGLGGSVPVRGGVPATTVGDERSSSRGVEIAGRVFIVLVCATVWVPWSVQLAGLNLRLSQMAIPFVLVVLWRDRPRLVATRTSLVLFGYAALFVGSIAFWTAANREVGLQAFGRVALHALNLVQMAIAYMLVIRTGRLLAFVRTFIVTVAVFNLCFIGLAIGVHAGLVPSFGIVTEAVQPVLTEEGGVGAAVVSRFELGGVAAGCLSAAALGAFFALRARRGGRGFALSVAAIGLALGAGLIVGFSRQGLVSLVAAVAVVVAGLGLAGRVRPLLRSASWFGLFVAGSVGVMLVVPGLRGYLDAFTGRALLLFDEQAYGAGTVGERSRMWGLMLEDVARNPLAGQGQDAYLQYFPYENGAGSHNLFIEAVHAGGLEALLPLLMLHLAAAGRGVWAFRRLRRQGDDRAVVLAVLAAASATVLAALTNLIFWNPTYWLPLGWLLAAGRLYGATSRAAAVDSA